jgi:hypothetical protein
VRDTGHVAQTGIGNLYENGFDAAAEHMELALWGLPHRLQSAR